MRSLMHLVSLTNTTLLNEISTLKFNGKTLRKVQNITSISYQENTLSFLDFMITAP